MIENLRNTVTTFVNSCGRSYEFPAGGKVELLTVHEMELLSLMQRCDFSDGKTIKLISTERDWRACYFIVIFAVRIAILSVRNNNHALFRIGVCVLAAGITKVDWRDILGAFAIFDDCGVRLGLDFQAALEEVAPYCEGEYLQQSMNNYFSRSHEMRSVNVMGYMKIGDGDSLTFQPK